RTRPPRSPTFPYTTLFRSLANAYLAIENNLEIVPAANKIDLPQADPDGTAIELADLVGDTPDHVLRISAKTGEGDADVLDAVIRSEEHTSELQSHLNLVCR